MEFKNSKTAENLMKAFAGESQARMRYSYYASVARKEGFRQIEAIFNETAGNEKEHAKLFMKQLIKNGINKEAAVINDAAYPVCYDDTLSNCNAQLMAKRKSGLDYILLLPRRPRKRVIPKWQKLSV